MDSAESVIGSNFELSIWSPNHKLPPRSVQLGVVHEQLSLQVWD